MNTFDINAQKRDKITIWLARFGFSTRDLLSKMLGVNVDGQGAFFKQLVESGITKEEYVPGTRKRVITLTPGGIQQARIYQPDLEVKSLRKFPLHILIHSYSLQAFLITQEGVKDFFSGPELAKRKFIRRPDLLIVNDAGVKIAIAVELTQKDVNRVYFNLYGHVQDWQQKRVDRVIYLFSSPVVLARYEELYQKNSWPKFITADGNIRHMSRSGSIDPSHAHFHELIYFHKFEPYAL